MKNLELKFYLQILRPIEINLQRANSEFEFMNSNSLTQLH